MSIRATNFDGPVRGPGHRPNARRRSLALGLVLTLAGTLVPASAAVAAGPSPAVPCATSSSGAVLVTPDCTDADYATPVIDSTTDEASPVPHRQVLGHFAENPAIKFEIHLPPASQWKGRFFQYTYPLTDEKSSDESIAFGAASGAYTVQAGGPPPVLGYRHSAAAAKFAEKVAADYYGTAKPIRGYLYGPSGGSFQTVGAAEGTTGVWDGFAPMVLGVPMSAPYTFFIRGMADLVLGDDAASISDAVQPGGSGDPYAKLDAAEKSFLKEMTSFGVPLRGWEDPDYLLGRSQFTPDGLMGFGAVVRQLDPTYSDDFWSKPGYLGTEKSPLGDLVRAALIDVEATVASTDGSPATSVTLTGLPAIGDPRDLAFTVLGQDGAVVGALTGTFDAALGKLSIGAGNSEAVLKALATGGAVRVDNRWALALRTYYRHQVPAKADGYVGFDQFRSADGTPRYPQRPLLIGPLITGSTTGGATFSGKINGKMIVIESLIDTDALPYHADWYANRVRSSLGEKKTGDTLRVYVQDAADHQDAPVSGARATHLVNWNGAVEQALRDLSAWVEKGSAPPASTKYSVKDAQLVLSAQANARRGIQPVVDLSVKGRDRVEVRVGDSVTFKGQVTVPEGTGKVVETAWDFAGKGEYTATAVRRPERTVSVQERHTFTQPGTYYVALRATSNRDGLNDGYADVQNLDRVRVVVRPGRS